VRATGGIIKAKRTGVYIGGKRRIDGNRQYCRQRRLIGLNEARAAISLAGWSGIAPSVPHRDDIDAVNAVGEVRFP
jgi:hypothetical protein